MADEMTSRHEQRIFGATLIVMVLAFSSEQAGAAIQKAPVVPPKLGQSAPAATAARVELSQTRSALGLPLANRLQVLQDQGPDGYRNLVAIMFDKTMSMDLRWRAVTAAARIGGSESLPEIEKAMVSTEWYMRNAGLIAMQQVDREQAVSWARKLLSDKALVVRSAAVDAIASAGDVSSTALLWEKLNSRENFKGRQSLFIRRKIVETLARLEAPGREGKFIAVLGDADESLHAPAVQALERMTQRKLGNAKEPMKFKRAHWQRWWEEKNQAKM